MLPPPGEDTRVADLTRRITALENALRSAFTTISGGRGLRITDGGSLVMEKGDVVSFYAGPSGPRLPDGSYQQVVTWSRQDGTLAAALYDPTGTDDGSVDQAFNLLDHKGNVIVAEDVVSGQGLARPLTPLVFYPAFFSGVTSTTAQTFTTLWRATTYKHQPKLLVGVSSVPTGTTADLQVLVNGQPLGAAQSVPAGGGAYLFGPAAVAGDHMTSLTVEIQARCVGAGSVQVAPTVGSGYPS